MSAARGGDGAGERSTDAAEGFVAAHTAVDRPPLVPEVRLHLAAAITPIWQATEDWLAAEQAAWRAVVALPPSDDPAMQSLQAEGRRSIERGDVYRRVLGVGRRP